MRHCSAGLALLACLVAVPVQAQVQTCNGIGCTPAAIVTGSAAISPVLFQQPWGTVHQDDLSSGGLYTGTVPTMYCVKVVDSTHFSWGTLTGWSTWLTTPNCTNGSASVAITGSVQTLAQGVTITFGHASGYTAADQGLFVAFPVAQTAPMITGPQLIVVPPEGGVGTVYTGTYRSKAAIQFYSEPELWGTAIKLYNTGVVAPVATLDSTGQFRTTQGIIVSPIHNNPNSDDGLIVNGLDGTGDPVDSAWDLSCVSDVAGACFQSVAHSPGSWIMSGYDSGNHYVYEVAADGKLRWGTNRRANLDADFGRLAAGVVGTSGSLKAAGYQANSLTGITLDGGSCPAGQHITITHIEAGIVTAAGCAP